MWAESSTTWVRDYSADDLDYMMHWCLVFHGAFQARRKTKRYGCQQTSGVRKGVTTSFSMAIQGR